jgi:predicted short-subunit dehydrogenase-like oxidoreductase (DUF2520 family)
MPRRASASQPIALIGPGRLGQALGRLLAILGERIGWVAARRPAAARQAVRFIGAGHAVTLESAELAQARVLLITTSDAALSSVAEKLAAGRDDWKGSVVLHTSGAWPAGGAASVLAPLRSRGASAGSFHPLQTVPSREAGVRNLAGCSWALEGDRAATQVARRWVRMLRGSAFIIDPDRKAAYHAAAVIACAGVVTLMETSRRLLERCGVAPNKARNMLQAFVSETARNFAELGALRALTGPAVRDDWPTINRHIAALSEESPAAARLYRELTRQMLALRGKERGFA